MKSFKILKLQKRYVHGVLLILVCSILTLPFFSPSSFGENTIPSNLDEVDYKTRQRLELAEEEIDLLVAEHRVRAVKCAKIRDAENFATYNSKMDALNSKSRAGDISRWEYKDKAVEATQEYERERSKIGAECYRTAGCFIRMKEIYYEYRKKMFALNENFP